MILDINIAKNRKNKTVSDLNIGDKVRRTSYLTTRTVKALMPSGLVRFLQLLKSLVVLLHYMIIPNTSESSC